jgi:predicted SprT family Zn-dependent metalloprotease
MLLSDVKILAESLIEYHGLKNRGWIFDFDNAVGRCGVCKYRSRRIQLSKHYASLNNEKNVKDTILHEIAHALVGPGHGHSDIWRSKAIEIGCMGHRCKSERTHEGYVSTPRKYIATCNRCNNNFFRSRLPKRVTSCGNCSNSFNPDLRLVYVVNHNKLQK